MFKAVGSIEVILCFYCEERAETMSLSCLILNWHTVHWYSAALTDDVMCHDLVTVLCNFRGGSTMFTLLASSSVTRLNFTTFVCAYENFSYYCLLYRK